MRIVHVHVNASHVLLPVSCICLRVVHVFILYIQATQTFALQASACTGSPLITHRLCVTLHAAGPELSLVVTVVTLSTGS